MTSSPVLLASESPPFHDVLLFLMLRLIDHADLQHKVEDFIEPV
jgi:hypothetical protein